MASGEFLWIAEADDLSDPTFLVEPAGADEGRPGHCARVLRFRRSIDAEGTHVYASYKPYFATIEPDALSRTEVFEGRDFVTRYLAVKNTILNVSSVLWRRAALLARAGRCRRGPGGYPHGRRLAALSGSARRRPVPGSPMSPIRSTCTGGTRRASPIR